MHWVRDCKGSIVNRVTDHKSQSFFHVSVNNFTRLFLFKLSHFHFLLHSMIPINGPIVDKVVDRQ